MTMNNSQFDAIMRKYDKLQLQHKHELDKRFEEIYEKIPEYKVLDEAASTISVSYGKKLIEGNKSALNDLKSHLAALSSQKEQLLLTNGYPKDYLTIQYNCKFCKDTGYIEGKKCSCLKNQMISILYAQSNIQDKLETENFNALSEEYYEGDDLISFQRTVTACHNLINNYPNKADNILIMGHVGVGKSFLSCCVAKEFLDRGYSVLYLSAASLFDVLSSNEFRKNTKENLYTSNEDIYNCDLVVIDDLGTEMTNNFVISALFNLINARLLNNKSTIISSNIFLEELRDRYTERIASRIASKYKLCKLSGKDIRRYKK